MTHVARDGAASTVVLSICATVVSAVTVFLISALFVLIGREMVVPGWSLGVIVSVYWTAAALTSGPAGRLTTRIGSRRVIILTIGVAFVALAGSALLTPSWPFFLVWGALGGVATGLCHPSTNHLISLRVPLERRAFAFGLKQSAVPIASLLSGLALPGISEQLGWRAVYIAAAIGTVAVLVLFFLLGPRRPPKGVPRTMTSVPLEPHERRFFLALACSTMLGAGAAACVSTWAVVSGVDHGLDLGTAGFLLAGGSLIGAIMRIAVGALERGRGKTLRTIGIMQLLGGLGAISMLIPGIPTFGLGVALALGIGWGWTGLGHFVVSQRAGAATPSATGLVQTGSYLGCAIGPLLTGILYANAGSGPIWIVCLCAFVVAGTIALLLQRVTTRESRT